MKTLGPSAHRRPAYESSKLVDEPTDLHCRLAQCKHLVLAPGGQLLGLLLR